MSPFGFGVAAPGWRPTVGGFSGCSWLSGGIIIPPPPPHPLSVLPAAASAAATATASSAVGSPSLPFATSPLTSSAAAGVPTTTGRAFGISPFAGLSSPTESVGADVPAPGVISQGSLLPSDSGVVAPAVTDEAAFAAACATARTYDFRKQRGMRRIPTIAEVVAARARRNATAADTAATTTVAGTDPAATTTE
jgi:hypothetical protein